MLSSSLRTLLVALVAAVSVAPAVSATPCLTVKASVPEFTIQLLGFKNLNVTTTVANTGSKTLKLLHDPRSVLSNFPSDAFIITNSAGPSPPFKGVTIKWSPTHAASLNDPSVFVILNPGQSIDVVHDLSVAYDFDQSGGGNYTIKPSDVFTYVKADNTPVELHATVGDVAQVYISGYAYPPGGIPIPNNVNRGLGHQ